jgi:uncharacterized protein (TIGR03083 family)
MDVQDHLAALQRDGELLAAAARRVDHAARPPACPDWTVADVIRHLGLVHRWAAAVVRERRADGEVDVADDGAGVSGADLVDWFAAGHAALVRTMAAADPAADFFSFLPAPSPLAFWARRQAHETGIHRADVEGAGGPVTPFPADVAVDGIEEVLLGFGARPRPAWTGPERTMDLLPTDVPGRSGWRVRLGRDGARVTEPVGTPGAECAVRATASDLHLLLWNRLDHRELEVSGDRSALDAWRGTVRVRWAGPPPPGVPSPPR